MNTLTGSLLACLVTLGFKHNSLRKKSMHGLLCATLFFTCNTFVWIGQVYPSIYITFAYMVFMMTWTFYVRYPLYCTYVKILGGSNDPQLSVLSQVNNRLVLKPFTPKWKTEFLAEHSRTRPLLLSKWKHILHPQLSPAGLVHIGSTAITDIALAKPQHDCALAITCNTLPTQFRTDLATLGYTYIGVAPHSLDCSDHFFFFIPNEEDKHRLGEGYFLHVLTPNVHEWLRTSQVFCEYLSANQAARNSYASLKSKFATSRKKWVNILHTLTYTQFTSGLFRFSGPYTLKKYDLVMKLWKEAKIWAVNRSKTQ